MKIKIDRNEYEGLLDRVTTLEEKVEQSQKYADVLMKRMREEINSYFENKCRVVMMKRDKDMIVAELRKQAVENIFREESK